MQYKIIKASKSLESFVKHFWLLDVSENDIPFSQHLLPYGWFELFFYLSELPEIKIEGSKENYRPFESTFTGQLTNSLFIEYKKPFRAIGISFQPWAGNLLFDIPANCFADQSIDLNDIDKDCRIRAQLIEAKSESEMIGLLEAYISQKLKYHKADPLSTGIADLILKNPSTDRPYKALVSNATYSRRRIEQRFLSATGVHMSRFIRTARFEKTIQYMEEKKQDSFTQIGLDMGYYDQAHFSREFKKLSGITAKEYREKLTKMSEMEYHLMSC